MLKKHVSERIVTCEYGRPEQLHKQAQLIGISVRSLKELLNRAAKRIASVTGIQNPIIWGDGTFRVVDIAGILKLTTGLDIEIKPKFLYSDDLDWREDFFYIANLSRYGCVLPRESLPSKLTGQRDLADLLADAMVNMYAQNQRRPLRAYRHRTWKSFLVNGQVDAEDLLKPTLDGFKQKGLMLDRNNPFNRTIYLAMSNILPEVKDGDTRRKLAHTMLKLSPQKDSKRIRSRSIPSRHRRWQDLYDLSKEICSGFGLSYGDIGYGALPGYIVQTADAWERLILIGLRAALKDRKVFKKPYLLGQRKSIMTKTKDLRVYPDITIINSGICTLIVDPKYKTGTTKKSHLEPLLLREDIYETLSFLRSAACPRALLIYPATEPLNLKQNPGAAAVFERVTVDRYEIIGVQVDVRGISKKSGFSKLCKNLADNIYAWELCSKNSSVN